MLENKDLTKRKAVRICSRPDMGIVEVLDVMRFGKLSCARTSKGGIFDRFDLIPVKQEEEQLFRSRGESFSHTKKDWLKMSVSVTQFFCTDRKQIMTIPECRACYDVKLDRPVTRAECKNENAIDVKESHTTLNTTTASAPASVPVDAGILNIGNKGIQDLRLEQLSSLNKTPLSKE
ncbi:MAG: hypothetical protein HQK96_01545 [Nitrospirae bacterium]|nr:hypothetical protein [Nitrospirota bacterium]